MNIRYRVDLSEAERVELEALLRAAGRHAARKLKRAQILLAADAGMPDETIAQSLYVGGSTVYRTRRRFVEGNLDKALTEEPRPGVKAEALSAFGVSQACHAAAAAQGADAVICMLSSAEADRCRPARYAWDAPSPPGGDGHARIHPGHRRP